MPYKDPARQKAAQEKRGAERRAVIDGFISGKKAEVGCARCGERDPVALSFHHRNPGQKKFAIGAGKSRNFESILEEMTKCTVLCHNCHAKLHAGRFSL